MDHRARAQELRDNTQRHYNCAQAVAIPFAEELGMDGETMAGLAAHFGAGMRRGSACGAVTGGLMALGLLGADKADAEAFQARFQERAKALDCALLLERQEQAGLEKKPYCDGLIALGVELVEQWKAERA